MAPVIIFTIGCSSSKDDNLNAKSVEIHNLAVKKGEEMAEKLQMIKQFSRNVESSLNPAFLDSINLLKEDYYSWKSNIVEVPGHAHDHHDHEGHDDHVHDHEPDLTPQMILDIQQFMLAEIEKLNVRAAQLIHNIENKALQSSFSSDK